MLLLLVICFLSFNKPESQTDEKLSETQLQFIIENYHWNSEDLIIVNFKQPRSSCHYDNYKNLKQSSEWWTEYYSKMELVNVRNIFVYSESKKATEIIDSQNHFSDISNFFLDNFFNKEQSCYGILVINKKGEFQKKNGEYTQEDIVKYINILN
ncbi:hypothetical protein LX78_01672 [Xanthomarina spongicola]|uniref:Uncharacterized protein n=2 Tax=Xanthomarina spongicola TaxID=570520 RepID=A0A316DMD0_9FLAO|nr:hypothetical protein LX78_01672 [Xanthomarina spongicola]